MPTTEGHRFAAPPPDDETPELVEPVWDEEPTLAEVDDADDDAPTNDVAAAEEDVPAEDVPMEVTLLDPVAAAEDERVELDPNETALLFMLRELVPREDVTVVLVEPTTLPLLEDAPVPPEVLLLLESPVFEVHAPRPSRNTANKTRGFMGHPCVAPWQRDV